MNATGSVTFGGTVFGACTADIKTDDGHSYHFKGYFGEIGTPNVGYGTNFSGDFPGLSHIEGSCWFEVAAAAIGPGGFDVGLGGGSWNDEEWKAGQKSRKR